MPTTDNTATDNTARGEHACGGQQQHAQDNQPQNQHREPQRQPFLPVNLKQRDGTDTGAERSRSGINGARDGMKRRASHTIGVRLPGLPLVKKM